MKISTKGRYALRMLVDLAQHEAGGYVALKDIAKRQSISKKYLEQIVPVLCRGHVLQTSRGFAGGYKLACPPAQCTVGQILRLTEGSLAPVSCTGESPVPCEQMASCATYPLWQGLYRVITTYLDGVTLQDLIDRQSENYANDYSI